MFRKGSLSISTNAIVVLIIAVVMLGLILGLVTTGFQMVEDRFFEELQNEPDPSNPTSSDRITINKENINARGGDTIGFKFAVFNNHEEASIEDEHVSVRCSEDVPWDEDTGITAETVTLAPRQSDVFTWVADLDSSPEASTYLCRVRVEGVEQLQGHSASFRINIR